MQGKIVPRAKFSLGFIIGGGVLIVLGLLLQFAVDLSKVIFDLPVSASSSPSTAASSIPGAPPSATSRSPKKRRKPS